MRISGQIVGKCTDWHRHGKSKRENCPDTGELRSQCHNRMVGVTGTIIGDDEGISGMDSRILSVQLLTLVGCAQEA